MERTQRDDCATIKSKKCMSISECELWGKAHAVSFKRRARVRSALRTCESLLTVKDLDQASKAIEIFKYFDVTL